MIALLVFVVVQTFLITNQLYATNPVCNSENFASWTWYIDAFQCGAFATTFFVHLSTINSSYSYKLLLDSTLAISTVSFLAFLSSLSTIVANWGGVCADFFG